MLPAALSHAPHRPATTHPQAEIISLERNALTGPAFPPAWLEGYMPGLLHLGLSDNTGLTGSLPATLPWPQLATL